MGRVDRPERPHRDPHQQRVRAGVQALRRGRVACRHVPRDEVDRAQVGEAERADMQALEGDELPEAGREAVQLQFSPGQSLVLGLVLVLIVVLGIAPSLLTGLL